MNASRPILLVARPWARAAAIAAAVIGAAGSALAQTVTWTGANNSWTQPDSDSFDAEYVSGATAVFAGAGSGSTITLGGGLTPGQVNVTDGNYTFSGGGIGGTGGLAKSGTGQLTLSASNSFTGNTTVDGGTLLLSNSNALQGSTFAGGAGTLAFGNTSSTYYTFGGLSGSSAVSLTSTNNSAVSLAFGANNSSTAYSGNVTAAIAGGNIGVIKIGTGTTTISGNWTLGVNGVVSDGAMNVFDGEIRQDGGTVTLRRNQFSGAFLVGSSSGSTGRYTITSGTVLATNSATPGGSNFRIGSNGGTGILTIDGGSARAFFSGINNNLGGNEGNNTSGTGTINLIAGELAVNSLTTGGVAGSTGSFNFSGGTLRPYDQDTTIGGFTGFTIALAGTSATLSGIDAAGTARTLTILTTLVDGTAGAGGLNVSGGTVVLPRTNSYTGDTTVSSGTLSIGSGSTAGSIPGNVANNGTLVFNRSNAITYSGTISGSGNLLKQGGGTLTLSASNSFTGSTSVSGGALSLAAGGSFANSTSISVAAGATLGLTSKTSGFTFGSGQTLGGSGSVALPTSGTGVSLAGFLAPGGGLAGTLAFTNAGTFSIESAITAGTNRLQFGLGTVSDQVTVADGTLAIGTGQLEFNDFDFTQLTGFDQGTYTLFSALSLSGTLGASTSGSIGSFTGTLSRVGNTVQLVVVPEPGTLPLAGLGFAAAAWAFRRRAAVR